MTMKGIILAGGSGTRLYPATSVISKQLLPIYDKPMVYYPLSCLMLAGIREILLISTPHDMPLFQKLLGTGSQWGIKLSYKVQPSPDGIAQSLLLAEDFLQKSPCCLILGDNIFHGHDLPVLLSKARNSTNGAVIFAYHVNDPERYGVVEFNANNEVLSIEEKPLKPKSPFAVTGLYFYDEHAVDYAKTLRPSARGELEITELNKIYLQKNRLNVQLMGRGYSWLDTGTHESLLEASNYIHILESRQGLKVACLEEIAYRQNWITADQLREQATLLSKNQYGKYLLKLLK